MDEFLAVDETANESKAGNKVRPDIRVVQPEVDREGKPIFKSVGGMWRGTSKAGNEFYTLRIGSLKLLAFPNKKKEQAELG